jgi:hypothetical protein
MRMAPPPPPERSCSTEYGLNRLTVPHSRVDVGLTVLNDKVWMGMV